MPSPAKQIATRGQIQPASPRLEPVGNIQHSNGDGRVVLPISLARGYDSPITSANVCDCVLLLALSAKGIRQMTGFSLDENVPFATNHDPRCACVLLLDTSASMTGQPIDQMNTGLRDFQQALQGDPLARRRVEIAIVTFGNFGVQVAHDFVTADEFRAPTLIAGGLTPLGEATTRALDMVRERKEVYKRNGVEYYRPGSSSSPMASQMTTGRQLSRVCMMRRRQSPSRSSPSALTKRTWPSYSRSPSVPRLSCAVWNLARCSSGSRAAWGVSRRARLVRKSRSRPPRDGQWCSP